MAGIKLTKVVQFFSADVLTLAEVSEQKRAIDATKAAALAEVDRIDAALAHYAQVKVSHPGCATGGLKPPPALDLRSLPSQACSGRAGGLRTRSRGLQSPGRRSTTPVGLLYVAALPPQRTI